MKQPPHFYEGVNFCLLLINSAIINTYIIYTMTSSRREIRILIVQALFENDFNDTIPDSSSLMLLFNRLAFEYNPDLVDNPFAKNVLVGIVSKYNEINKIIEQASPDWPLDKIGSVDRNILRLGVFELLFGKEFEVPGRVALNEAIEITKAFLDDSSRKFINGVLGAIYLEVKSPEDDINTPKKIQHKKSVGGIIFRNTSEILLFSFVHDVFGKWTLPKGGLEDNESTEVGFKRVVKDKLNIDVEILEKIASNSYIAHPPEGAVRKDVLYLLGKTEDETLTLKKMEGLDEAKWFTYEEAKNLAFYPDLKQIILTGMSRVQEIYAAQNKK